MSKRKDKTLTFRVKAWQRFAQSLSTWFTAPAVELRAQCEKFMPDIPIDRDRDFYLKILLTAEAGTIVTGFKGQFSTKEVAPAPIRTFTCLSCTTVHNNGPMPHSDDVYYCDHCHAGFAMWHVYECGCKHGQNFHNCPDHGKPFTELKYNEKGS